MQSSKKPIKQFEIADDSNVFHPANAFIHQNAVVLSSKHVKNPTQARYNWNCAPIAELYNSSHIPVLPFRTNPSKLLVSHMGNPKKINTIHSINGFTFLPNSNTQLYQSSIEQMSLKVHDAAPLNVNTPTVLTVENPDQSRSLTPHTDLANALQSFQINTQILEVQNLAILEFHNHFGQNNLEDWAEDYRNAILTLRNNGIVCPVLLQLPQGYILDNAWIAAVKALLEIDHNLMVKIQNQTQVGFEKLHTAIAAFKAAEIPVMLELSFPDPEAVRIAGSYYVAYFRKSGDSK
jgi:hypothetical protein